MLELTPGELLTTTRSVPAVRHGMATVYCAKLLAESRRLASTPKEGANDVERFGRRLEEHIVTNVRQRPDLDIAKLVAIGLGTRDRCGVAIAAEDQHGTRNRRKQRREVQRHEDALPGHVQPVPDWKQMDVFRDYLPGTPEESMP